MVANHNWSFTVSSGSGCGNSATFIHTLQGNTDVSPLSGQTDVVIEGVVVGDFQGSTGLDGFFVQEEDSQADSDPATSEGVFVYYSAVDVNVGDIVRVQGDVVEYFNLTEIKNVDSVVICPGSAAVTPASVSLPVTALADLERYEGMLINIPHTLYVTELYQLGRYGQISLSVNDRLFQPTNVYPPSSDPDSDRVQLQDLNDRSRILLDDGSGAQNPDPIIYPQGGLTAGNTLRAGYSLPSLTGVLYYAFSNYMVEPTTAINFTGTNPRSAAQSSDSSLVRVASFNVLNYFVTFGSRGAENQTEFDRQRAKTISAILQLNADVIGLMEMENHSTDAALKDLVDGLNASAGAGTYTYVDTGVLGTDAIKVALIYKPARVSPVVGTEVTNTDTVFSRPPLAQTFQQTATGEQFTVVVNHFKSKGGCDYATGLDQDQNDGQGCYNDQRKQQATAITTWIKDTVLPGATGSKGALIIGDLNAYAMEDPVTIIKNAGYVDMINTFIPAGAYSYVFDGQSGYLDHALASTSLAPWVADVQEWHINADEPTVLDYNTNYKTVNQISTLYAPDAYRASDHDPVLVLLDFVNTYVDDDYTTSILGWGTNRFATIQGGINAATVGRTVYVENLSANAETYAESVTLNKAITLAIQDDIRLVGALTLETGTVEAPAGTLTLSGNFTHSGGTFNHNSGAVVFDGAGTFAYAGSGTTFYDLLVNAGTVLDIGTGFAVVNTVTNNGGLQESKTVNGASVAFLNISTDKYYGVNINTADNMGATTVTVWGNQACAGASGSTILRCFDVTPGTAQTAEVTFYYRGAEANGNTAPIPWHWNGVAWETVADSTRGGSGEGYWVQATVSSYSPFTLGDNQPTAVFLTSFAAAPQGESILLAWETAAELQNLGFNLYRAESAAGPWTKLNPTLIPAQNPGATFGASYEWLDTGVTLDTTYFYRLEDIDVNGASTFHGPVSATAAGVTAVSVVAFGARSSLAGLALALALAAALALRMNHWAGHGAEVRWQRGGPGIKNKGRIRFLCDF
ncbi:MAG: ExeM/NucH family extracellular endonuclease [Anaerolineae bacterium]|nr:ExeM/NucH family extracellular endonuclease [Anaerolineae bacterium]